MDQIDFILNGKRYQLTRDAVVRSMRKQIPGRIQTYAVEVDGTRFPVKQVLAQALQVPVTDFVSTRAQDLLRKLGFDVINVETGDSDARPVASGEERWRALELAVDLLAGRDDVDASAAIGAAGRFLDWAKPADG